MDPAAIHAFLRTAHWSQGVRRDVVERAIAHSEVAGAFETASGAQVGFARVVTDYATFAWLCDVFVAEPHRARGLALGMIRALEALPCLHGLRRWCLATRDAHGLYQRLGYQPVDPDRWMVRLSPPHTWREEGWPA
ncbi:MAG: GNAT family N-acetyltransferase [Phycisphaeraceae bacterium]|nr:GNAT family N-acetyltransferase [Phycisphaeraceae bacterium]